MLVVKICGVLRKQPSARSKTDIYRCLKVLLHVLLILLMAPLWLEPRYMCPSLQLLCLSYIQRRALVWTTRTKLHITIQFSTFLLIWNSLLAVLNFLALTDIAPIHTILIVRKNEWLWPVMNHQWLHRLYYKFSIFFSCRRCSWSRNREMRRRAADELPNFSTSTGAMGGTQYWNYREDL